MRPPTLPMPQLAKATPHPAVAGKSARKPASSAPSNRADRKTSSGNDSAPAHKTNRRKSASSETAADKPDPTVDFAAMLAQNAAQPTAVPPAQAPATGHDSSDGEVLAADSAAALLRPWEALASAIGTGAEQDADGPAVAAGADDAAGVATAGTTAANAPAGAERDPATTETSSPISIPSELASAAAAVPTKAPETASSAAHRAATNEAAHRDQLSTSPVAEMPDLGSVAAPTTADGTSTSGEQSTGDAQAGQSQPDFAGAAAAAGVQHSSAGPTDAVSETPMPAHTVAPTIAQVAHSLRSSGDGTSRLVIRLDPVELGPVLVSLRTRGGAVDISVRADNAGGAAAVADQRAHIQQVLADHGLDLSSFNVSGGDASGGAGTSTADASTSDGSTDNSSNSNSGSDAHAPSYEDVQAQASGADGQPGERRAFGAPRDNAGISGTSGLATSSDDAAATPVRSVRREGTWL